MKGHTKLCQCQINGKHQIGKSNKIQTTAWPDGPSLESAVEFENDKKRDKLKKTFILVLKEWKSEKRERNKEWKSSVKERLLESGWWDKLIEFAGKTEDRKLVSYLLRRGGVGGFWIRRGALVGEFWIRGNEVDQSKAENSCQIISQFEWGENYLPVGWKQANSFHRLSLL